MGREEFNKLTDKQKDEIHDQILAKMDELTEMKESFDEEFDFFDAVNDEVIGCFECNGICTSCTVEDLKKCVYNFRVGNVFLLKKLKLYENEMGKFMEGLILWSKTFLKWLQSDADIKSEIEKIKTTEPKVDIYS